MPEELFVFEYDATHIPRLYALLAHYRQRHLLQEMNGFRRTDHINPLDLTKHKGPNVSHPLGLLLWNNQMACEPTHSLQDDSRLLRCFVASIIPGNNVFTILLFIIIRVLRYIYLSVRK